MKYIGTVSAEPVETPGWTETRIQIEGLPRGCNLLVKWADGRAAAALTQLTVGTQIIFAAREGTFARRSATVIEVWGVFFDLVSPRFPSARRIYGSFTKRPMRLEGTVVDIPEPWDRSAGQRMELSVVAREGLEIVSRWDGGCADQLAMLADIGDTLMFTALEESLELVWTWNEEGTQKFRVPAVKGVACRLRGV
ncbi:hypothetical protein BJF89_08100 [Corynebacterium sp. CNJ-954]|jgi:hypothetical protein|uniref:hypothetical protein n=1 Tax=Corynebacterium sp. CNJ-954 TaxID=1904962 RepID=UPI00095E4B81|nr:hypothetical protein [Corynebacterium sp. CNJ-954]OLT51084.1 hypothetical protein BJF89_08100 [Corynebacterium sp. CNJ-954]